MRMWSIRNKYYIDLQHTLVQIQRQWVHEFILVYAQCAKKKLKKSALKIAKLGTNFFYA